MPNYTTLTAEFELITPAFIGGAGEFHAPQGIDPKSIKSALRRWWRALHWGGILQAHDNNANIALQRLHANEMRLFGEEAKSDGKGGQGVLQVVLRQPIKPLTSLPSGKFPLSAGIIYLLGLGLYDRKKCDNPQGDNDLYGINTGMTRDAIVPGHFTIDLILFYPKDNSMAELDRQQLELALKAFGLLGNLGSRQNRGCGSLALRRFGEKDKDDLQPFATTPAAYRQEVEKLFLIAPQATLPLIPSFTCHAQGNEAQCLLLIPDDNNEITVSSSKPENLRKLKRRADNAWALLALIGEQFMLERSWGSNFKREGAPHKIGDGLLAEQKYEPDHALIKAAQGKGTSKASHTQVVPERSIYGLPFGFGQNYEMNVWLKDPNVPTDPAKPSRRSSPFHIHITTIGKQPIAVLYTLPSQFLPSSAVIKIGHTKSGKGLPDRDSSRVRFDFSIINRFLTRFPQTHKIFPPTTH
jgi:CRISPR-associated protein Cmr1